jgi:hypothetical protein
MKYKTVNGIFNYKLNILTYINLSFLTISLLFITSCSIFDSNDGEQNITLQADPGVTEVWIDLHIDKLKTDINYVIKRDSIEIFNDKITQNDKIIYDKGLLPNHSYKYTLYANGDKKANAEITTMDTTSHDFSWTTYEFGGINGSSYFNDVAIIDENDIWVVGEIHTEDTDQWNENSTKWVQPYNAAHWDGVKWKLLRINGHGSPRHAILAFGKNDIWFEGRTHWDGNKYEIHDNNFPLMPNGDCWQIYATWGTSSEDLYVVGDHGMIAHYNGKEWTKIESGVGKDGDDLPINDIYGKNNEIYLPACNTVLWEDASRTKKLLKLKGTVITYEEWNKDHRELASVWIDENNMLYTCGGGVFRRFPDNSWHEFTILGATFQGRSILTTRIRGNLSNDIYVVGHFGVLVHYNGLTWYSYTKFNEIDKFFSLDVKNDIVVAVGEKGGKAIIYKRN